MPTASNFSPSRSRRFGLEDADAIAANDAVDLLFVGPSDLSQAMGVLGQFSTRG